MVQGNTELYCINVDDSIWANNNWNFHPANNIDPWQYFSEDCDALTSIEKHPAKKELLTITDLLGREKNQANEPLIYLYDDGTTEKKIIIE